MQVLVSDCVVFARSTSLCQVCLHQGTPLLLQDKPRLDIGRLQRLSSGFGSFTTSGIRATDPAAATPVLDNNAKEVLKLVFNQRGSYLQVLCWTYDSVYDHAYGIVYGCNANTAVSSVESTCCNVWRMFVCMSAALRAQHICSYLTSIDSTAKHT